MRKTKAIYTIMYYNVVQ